MRTIVFSDVHGNLPALSTLIMREDADRWISLGDVVNYGPWSNECVDIVNMLCDIKLRGNHEDAFLIDGSGLVGLAKDFYYFYISSFTRQNEIKDWGYRYGEGGFTFTHTVGDQIIYPDSIPVLDGNYIIGHSHHQSYHKSKGYELYVIGSVGQNRGDLGQIDYLVIDNGYELKSMPYDYSLLIKGLETFGYPQKLIDYYLSKVKNGCGIV